MDPVILMIGRTNEGVHDVEVMPDVPAADLADAIALAFGWPGTYDIQVAGKMLSERQTLAEADIWDGSQLLLVSSSRAPRQMAAYGPQGGRRALQVPTPSATEPAGPVGGRRSLQVPNAPENASQLAQAPAQTPVIAGKRALQIPAAVPGAEESAAPASGWKPVIPEPPTQTPLSSPVTGWRQTPTAPEASKDDNPQP